MKFTTPCFVRVEDAVERRKLVEWLEVRIGYRYCVGCFNARSAIDSPWIPYVGVSSRAETGFVECFVQCPDEGIDCGKNIELFKALAAMNDENDREQWFVNDAYANIGCELWHLCEEKTFKHYYVDWEDGATDLRYDFRKATAEEIIEHFKN